MVAADRGGGLVGPDDAAQASADDNEIACCDGGRGVAGGLAGFELRDLRYALGVSLFRWVTPFGNFSLDYAVPLDPELGDNPLGRIHLTLGASLGI